ncbi:MAG: GlsB/YeaQ/YmgE family stress response membrane protein [Acidobacteria bacterium]|nr:MAG: GlsB/YeaQ/YmgE family stress response membrane protein [Acidobacteriota bacterium]
MIGMGFASFLSLLILGFIAAIVLHLIVCYKMLSGFDGFMNKWIAGWIGGWLGSPVLGHWGPSVSHVYIIPALLGAFIGAFVMTSIPKAASKAGAATLQQSPAAPVELKKAS